MKTKIKTTSAAICLIILSSCSILNEGSRYRALNKVRVNSQISTSEKSIVFADSLEVNETTKSEIISDSSWETTTASATTIKDGNAKKSVKTIKLNKQYDRSVQSPILKPDFGTTAKISRKPICIAHPSESSLNLFPICFIVSVVLTLIGFIAGWSGAWIMLILIGVVLPVIILFVWILLIFSAFNQNYSWGNS